MKTNQIKNIVVIAFVLCLSGISYGQSVCNDINDEGEIFMNCPDTCTTLHTDLIEMGETTSYDVVSIPYFPPYSFLGGMGATYIYTDDYWSELIDLEFDFSFFGNVFNHVIISSNGAISFSIEDVVPEGRYTPQEFCGWNFFTPIPSHSVSTTLPYVNAIMGVLQDSYPNEEYFENWTINYEVIGEAPCRKFVVNFYDLGMFGCSDEVGPQTYQMVLYETTNVIDIYVERRRTCTAWNSGSGLIGIQNKNGSEAYFPPGRNTGVWMADEEAWRFIPNDGIPTYTIEWKDEDGFVVATGNDAIVCPTSNSESVTYTATISYTPLEGGDVVELEDQIIVYPSEDVSPVVENPIEICEGESWIPQEGSDATYIWPEGIESGVPVEGNVGTDIFHVIAVGDNGCEVESDVFVTTHPKPNVSFEANPTEGYAPLTVEYNVLDDNDLTYNWDFGDGNSETTDSSEGNEVSNTFEEVGSYTTILSAENEFGCVDSSEIIINVIEEGGDGDEECEWQASTQQIDMDGVIFAYPSGADSYQWINCEVNQPVIGATNQIFLAQEEGEYAVIVTIGDCESTSDCVYSLPFDEDAGIETNAISKIRVYPNPMEEQLYIINDNGIIENVMLTTVEGSSVYSFTGICSELAINTTHFASGVYIVRIETNGEQKVVKVIK